MIGVKTVRKGTRAYFPRKKVQIVFEKAVRPMIEKEHNVHIEKNEDKETAGFLFGLRELKLKVNLNFNDYALNFVESRETGGRLLFMITNQVIKGQVRFHIQKKVHIIVDLGSIIDKEYTIDFAIKIPKIVVEARLFAGKEGIPQVDLKFSLEGLDLSSNLMFDVENKDLLSEVIELTQLLWLPIVETALTDTMAPKLNEEVTKGVNEAIQKEFKKEIVLKSPVNLTMDVTCHEITIENDFVIVTIDGHFNNSENPRDMDTVAAPTHDMPHITEQLEPDEIAVQISDDNLYTFIYAALQNKIDVDIDVDKLICNKITVFREPNYSTVVALLREYDDSDPEKKKIKGLQVSTELFVKVTVDLEAVPNFDVRLKAKALVDEIRIVKEKRTDTQFFLSIAISNIDVLSIFNEKMEPIVNLHTNQVCFNALRVKMAKNKITKEIIVEMVKVSDHMTFEAARFITAPNYLVMTGLLHFS